MTLNSRGQSQIKKKSNEEEGQTMIFFPTMTEKEKFYDFDKGPTTSAASI